MVAKTVNPITLSPRHIHIRTRSRHSCCLILMQGHTHTHKHYVPHKTRHDRILIPGLVLMVFYSVIPPVYHRLVCIPVLPPWPPFLHSHPLLPPPPYHTPRPRPLSPRK